MYRFKEKWKEDTPIKWWNENRKELNRIIEIYNKWQIDDNFNSDKSKIVLSNIQYGKQTIGSLEGGSGYLEELEDMEEFIRIKNYNN